jgi:hypothetical protein
MSYTSTADARSDLFLSGAVYLFGPILLNLLLGMVPLLRVPVLGVVIFLLIPIAVTVLVPALLIRYRRESLRQFGFSQGAVTAFALGVTVAVPIAVASVVGPLLGGHLRPPVLAPGTVTPLAMAHNLLEWLGVALLAVYGTVKARDAFGGDPRSVRVGAHEIGRILALVALVATLLLLGAYLVRNLGLVVDLPLLPLSIVGAVALAVMSLRGPSSTTRAVLLTPLVLLALSQRAFTFDALRFVEGLWRMTLLGGVGLAIGVLYESRRSVYAAIGVALVMAVFTGL